MALFKYLRAIHADAMRQRGEVLFRSLAYFHDLEASDPAADPYEGTRRYLPRGGLDLRTPDGKPYSVPEGTAFESKVRTSDIFVFCTSTKFDAVLGTKFKRDACVEIIDEAAFIAALRAALMLRKRVRPPKLLLAAPVSYYDAATPPIADWALPERIAMAKPTRYRDEGEFRFAFAIDNAFAVHNVSLVLTTAIRAPSLTRTSWPQMKLVLGDLRNCTEVHLLPTVVKEKRK